MSVRVEALPAAPVHEAQPKEPMLTPDMMFNNAPQQDSASETVLANYEAQIGLRERIRNLGHNVAEIAGRKKSAIVAAVGVGVVAAFGMSTAAEAKTITPTVVKEVKDGVEYTTTAQSAALIGKSEMSASSVAKFKIVGNHRTVSKAKARQAIKRGQCDKISGKKAMELGIRTQGKGGSGTEYALENRPSTMCDTNGDGKYDFRADCGNRAKGGRPNIPKAKQTLWVGNFNKYNGKVRSNVKVEASAACEINNEIGLVKSSSYASAESRVYADLKLRNVVKAGGKNVTQAETKNMNKVTLEFQQTLGAKVVSSCESKGGKIVTPEKPPVKPVCPPEAPNGEYPNCIPGKDGNQNPQTPPDAPGSNPAPARDEPFPGGYENYDPVTGAPITSSAV